ncbi:hypothetical protein [Flavobacterium selenitireducens]|uniref:hypothetical protein n=1 Tax=Flavobacterium selenitireducens TaxID=2722704 RepID=UPI00168B8415|nr:hypothetical protein [Flavobacterium selenitireducens]MBD3582541.1 hypothetical protein [Flavobacterium selenitireducens]
MKKTLMILGLLFAISGFSQTSESLKTRVAKLFEATNNLDMETVLNLTYNKAFGNADRAILLESMTAAVDNEYMTIEFTNPSPQPFTADAIKTIANRKFSVIRYQNSLKLHLKQKLDASVIKAMSDGMKEAGNYASVTYDEKTNSFTIEGYGIMVAVADESTKGEWEFVNYDNKELFNIVFNETIKKELGL